MSVGQGNDDAAATGDHGQLRASHDDRKQAVELLKAAFAQGRLTRDELDARVGQALDAKTYAQLAAVTAGLPSPVSKVARPRKGAAIAAGVVGAFVLSLAALAWLTAGPGGARPNPYLAVCRTFFMWLPQNPSNNNTMLLNTAVAEARRQVPDAFLTADLLDLQQAVQQNDQNSVDAAISQVTAQCSNNGA